MKTTFMSSKRLNVFTFAIDFMWIFHFRVFFSSFFSFNGPLKPSGVEEGVDGVLEDFTEGLRRRQVVHQAAYGDRLPRDLRLLPLPDHVHDHVGLEALVEQPRTPRLPLQSLSYGYYLKQKSIYYSVSLNHSAFDKVDRANALVGFSFKEV